MTGIEGEVIGGTEIGVAIGEGVFVLGGKVVGGFDVVSGVGEVIIGVGSTVCVGLGAGEAVRDGGRGT